MSIILGEIRYYPKNMDDTTMKELLSHLFVYSVECLVNNANRIDNFHYDTLIATFEFSDIIELCDVMMRPSVNTSDLLFVRAEIQKFFDKLLSDIEKMRLYDIYRKIIKNVHIVPYHSFIQSLYNKENKHKIHERAFRTWGYHNFDLFYETQLKNAKRSDIYKELKIIEVDHIEWMI